MKTSQSRIAFPAWLSRPSLLYMRWVWGPSRTLVNVSSQCIIFQTVFFLMSNSRGVTGFNSVPGYPIRVWTWLTITRAPHIGKSREKCGSTSYWDLPGIKKKTNGIGSFRPYIKYTRCGRINRWTFCGTHTALLGFDIIVTPEKQMYNYKISR